MLPALAGSPFWIGRRFLGDFIRDLPAAKKAKKTVK
jgi:hypothetical protein